MTSTRARRGPFTSVRIGLLTVVLLILASGSALEGGAQNTAQWVAIASFAVLALLPLTLLAIRAARAFGALVTRIRAWRDARAS